MEQAEQERVEQSHRDLDNQCKELRASVAGEYLLGEKTDLR